MKLNEKFYFFKKNKKYEYNIMYSPLSGIQQCFIICIWFPRHAYKDMVLFSAFVFTEIQNSDSFRGNQDNPQKSLKKHSNK